MNVIKKPIASRAELRRFFDLEARELGLETQIFSDGPLSSEVAVIGEGPGESEIRHGIPFAGGSGSTLLTELRKYSLARHNTYITNVVKRQISLSSKGDARHAVSRPELSKWISLLHWELEQLPNLRYILLMGNYAIEALLHHQGVTEWRGSVLDYDLPNTGRSVKLVLTFNPAYVLREPKLHPVFKMDLYKLGRVIAGKWKPHEIRPIINPDIRAVRKYLLEVANSPNPVALDIETTSRQVACIGLAIDPHEAMCINLRDDKINRFDLHEEIEILRSIQSILSKKKVIAQNGIFDSYYLWQRLNLKFTCNFDTMLAHHLLYPQLPHSLAFLTTQYTTHPYYKDEGKMWKEGGDVDMFWRYNCKDAALTYHIHTALTKSLIDKKLYDFFNNHVMRIQPHLIQATVHGIACDMNLKERLKEELREDVYAIKRELNRLVQDAVEDPDYELNPNSPAQLSDLLFKRLRLRGRGFSTDATNRARMLIDARTNDLAKEILTTIDKFKAEAKFLNTYVESEVDEDGRFRTVYKQHGVSKAPGRLSSSQTIDGTGMNLQNQPRRGYEMFMADPGCVFIYLDASQAEARVVGWYYDIEKWKEDFERARRDKSFDCHRALASDMFKIPYEETPTEDHDKNNRPTRRYIAKRCRHGLNYRMQANRLSEVTGLPYHEARRAWHIYHSLTPELRRGWQKEEEKARRTKELVNAYGRPWKIIQRVDERVLESIVAFYPQSTIGDHVQRAWYMAEEDEAWPTGKARVAMNIHDALIGIAEPQVAKKALSILKSHMENPILITNLYNTKTEPLIIPAECKISQPDENGIHRWSGLKAVEL